MTAAQAVTYLRVSGLGQVGGDGFARQREAVGIRAKDLGLEIGEEFRDEGVSGTAPLQDRPGLAALVEHVARERAGTVLVERSDRLARDLIEGELILREFRTLGVRVIEAEGGHDLTAGEGNPTATLVRQVLSAVAEFEKSALVAKLRAARDRKKRNGGHGVGTYRFGQHPGRPWEVETLERIKELRKVRPGRKRMPLREVAAVLNAEGRESRSGRLWTAAMVLGVRRRA
jgi:DNA invertase Pin-like site-specific DNA recombinase